jgi:hypothetical protein
LFLYLGSVVRHRSFRSGHFHRSNPWNGGGCFRRADRRFQRCAGERGHQLPLLHDYRYLWRFAFELLPPGDYSARAESPGMSPQTTPGLHVDVGGTTELVFKLAVAGTKETVTVSGEPPLVESQPSGLSSLIDERAINKLPLNGRRYTDLALLAPGVTQDPRGLTSGSNGDLGRAGGAVVNVVTKSGSNRLHGTDFYFLRDSSLSATHPSWDFKPHGQQQQFGFTLGGPVRRIRV